MRTEREVRCSLATVVLACVFLIGGPFGPQASAQRYGTIEGRVLDEHGQPLSGARVYPFPQDHPPPGIPLTAYTAQDGTFRLDPVTPGPYQVCALKEEDGYPNANATFYDADFPYPEVTVRDGEVIRDVTIRLGPKAGRLVGTVVDSATGKPIRNASITFYEARSTQEYLSTGLIWPKLDFNALAPSTKPFRIRVSAPGYQNWFYGGDGSEADAKPLRMTPGERKDLTIQLRPLPK